MKNKTTMLACAMGLVMVTSVGCGGEGGDEVSKWGSALEGDNGNHFGDLPFLLESPEFADGEALPSAHTCEGNPFATGVSPELDWTKGPQDTKSYAIVLADTTLVDAGQPNFAYHWAIWNIPHDRHLLPAGILGLDPTSTELAPLPDSLKGAEQAQARGVARFFGPCPAWSVTLAQRCGLPPVERTTDHYSFTLYALPEHDLDVPAHDPAVNTNYVDRLNTLFDSMALGKVTLTTTSDAVPSTVPFACPAE